MLLSKCLNNKIYTEVLLISKINACNDKTCVPLTYKTMLEEIFFFSPYMYVEIMNQLR